MNTYIISINTPDADINHGHIICSVKGNKLTNDLLDKLVLIADDTLENEKQELRLDYIDCDLDFSGHLDVEDLFHILAVTKSFNETDADLMFEHNPNFDDVEQVTSWLDELTAMVED